MSKRNKLSQKKADRQDKTKDKDYELFLRDLEDDPEMRQNVNLYKDEDVIARLERQVAGMSLNDEQSKLSKQM